MKEANGGRGAEKHLSGRVLQNSGMEANAQIKNAGTQMVLRVVQSGSDGSCNSSSGSAVSALQSKFKEISQRRSKGKEMHNVLLAGLTEPLHKNSGTEQTSLSIPDVRNCKWSSSADEVPEVQNLTTSSHLKHNKWKKEEDFIPSLDCALEERSKMENFMTSADGGTLLSKTSSPRCWAPSKGFWKAAQPETFGSNVEVNSLPITMKNASEKEKKLRVGVTVFRKKLRDVDDLESAFQRCFQKDRSPLNEPGREDISDILSHGTEIPKTEDAQTIKPTSAMLAEGQYQPPLINKGLPPSYKEANCDRQVVFGSELNWRSDSTLSPRHEQAKRLLERARLKARSRNENSDHGTQATQKEALELLPVRNPPLQIIKTIPKQKVREQGQLPNHVYSKDKPKKEEVCRYLDKVCEHGLVSKDNSLSNQQPKSQLPLTVSQGTKSLGSSKDSVVIPPAIMSIHGDSSLETVSCKDEPRKCESCGSILTPSHPKESTQNLEGQRNSGNQRVASGNLSQQIIQPNLLEGTLLSGSTSLDENADVKDTSDAGERVSAFGKLRRRSRKGENRVEASHGPYARGQDLLAQRRNSRTRSSLEEMARPFSKPVRGVTFATDFFIPTATSSRNYKDSAGKQLPIKSALKSGSKSKPKEQHGVKILPSAQDVESPHHAVATPQDLSAPSQVTQVTSGLTPCIKPSSLRYSSPVVTPLEPVDAHSPVEDPYCAASRPTECRLIVRGAAMSKTEDLRAELLRSEHRKAEIQWDENLAASRRSLEREGRPKLSLRRFFSAMGLNSMGKMVKGSRSSSMEQLSLSTARASPSFTHKTHLQRTPSLQALHSESPLAQLRKASSVQSLQSPKKIYERSAGEFYLPITLGPRDYHVKKGMENLDASQVSGPMGRIIQTYSDGSLLLELFRPVNAPFGFVISRGKGRPDSGIYVEQVRGSATENIYTSLLGIGDEILEVNGEKVTGLSLDQVTCLMTRDSMATVRILPHRWIQN